MLLKRFLPDSGKKSNTRLVTATKGEMDFMLTSIHNKLFSFP